MTIKQLGGIFGRNPTFNDVTIDGGIYFEDGQAGNLLDDYEEGSWTPTIFGSTSGTATLNVAANSYTKVGNIVRVDCLLTSVNVTGLSGSVRLGGFPFSVIGYAPITATYSNLFSFDETTTSVGGFTESGQTYCNLLKGSSKTSIQSTDATATNGSIMFTAVYKAIS